MRMMTGRSLWAVSRLMTSTSSHITTTRCSNLLSAQYQPSCRRYSAAAGGQYVVESSVPAMQFESGNFTEYLMKDVNQRTGSIAVTCTESGRDTSYGALRDDMARWGGYLQSRGLGKGAVVAVMAPNLPNYPTVVYGTIGVGGVYMGVNPSYTAGEVAHHLEDSGAQLVVVYGPLEPVVREALKTIKKNIPLLSIGQQNPGQLPRVEDILASTSIEHASPVSVSGTETMSLMYSSGTTGKPKAVAISHNAAIANLAMLTHPKFFSAASSTAKDQKSYLNLLPMFHISGFLGVASLGLVSGLRIHTMSKFDPNTFVDTITRSKISHLHLVPSLINFVLSQPQFNKENCGSVEGVMVGTAPVPPSAAAALIDRIGDHLRLQHRNLNYSPVLSYLYE